MRHFFRANVKGVGYSLFTYTYEDGIRRLPLDVQSERLPTGFLRAQRRIDSLLEQRQERLYLSASVVDGRALIVYGCLFGLPDEHGRKGLTFVHAVEGAPSQVEDLVSLVIALVSPDVLVATSRRVGDVATGAATVEDLIGGLDRVAPPVSSSRHGVPAPGSPRLGSIVHDCGGAPLAWMAMTRAHSGLPGPWEIHDTILDDGRVATVSSAGPRPQTLLSAYLEQAIRATEAHLPEPSRPVITPTDQPSAPEPAPPRIPPFRARGRLRTVAAAAVLAVVLIAGWLIIASPDQDEQPADQTPTPPSLLDSQLTLTAPKQPTGTSPYLVYRRGDGRLFPQGACQPRRTDRTTYTCTNPHPLDRRHTYTALLVFADRTTAGALDRASTKGLEKLPGDDESPAFQLTVSAP